MADAAFVQTVGVDVPSSSSTTINITPTAGKQVVQLDDNACDNLQQLGRALQKRKLEAFDVMGAGAEVRQPQLCGRTRMISGAGARYKLAQHRG